MFRRLLEKLGIEPVRCGIGSCTREAVGNLVVLLANGARRTLPGCRLHLQALTA